MKTLWRKNQEKLERSNISRLGTFKETSLKPKSTFPKKILLCFFHEFGGLKR
jgi:hypothetical protein